MDNRTSGTITGSLGIADSPLRVHLDSRFPHLEKVLRADYRKQKRPVLVPTAEDVKPTTLGIAFDSLVALRLDKTLLTDADGVLPYSPYGLIASNPAWVQLLSDIESATHLAVEDGTTNALVRAAWCLALGTEIVKTGLVWPTSPLFTLAQEGPVTPERLLDAAPPVMIDQLERLDAVAQDALYPELNQPCYAHVELAPSPLWVAEGDLFAGGLMLEIKTTVGHKMPDGSRDDRLLPLAFRQVLVYSLLATNPLNDVTEFALYSARFGHLQRWSLEETLTRLAGKKVNVDKERESLDRLFGGWGH